MSEKEKQDLNSLIKKSTRTVKRFKSQDIVEGKVVSIDKKYILLDVGAKSEGLLLVDEFKGQDTIKIGDKVTATVIYPENHQGNLILSTRKPRTSHGWGQLEDFYKQGEIIDVKVIDYLKGGLVVDVHGQRGFVPISHLNREHFELFNESMAKARGENNDLGGLKGSLIKVKVIEVNPEKNRLVMSEKEAMSTEEVEAKASRLAGINAGEVLEGKVSTILPYGILVDLGGVDGLVHISEIAWERVENPADYYKAGDNIKVKVIGKDEDRIALSVKELKDNPWDKVEERYPLGKTIKAKVTKVVPFGVFVELEPGLDGLIHISETVKPLETGDKVEAVVINVDSTSRKLALSVRQIEDAKIYR